MGKIKPNRPCYCGSGRKYKKCHGSPLAAEVVSPRMPQGIPLGYSLKRLENPPPELLEWGKRMFDAQPSPSAYVFLTNLPFHHHPDAAQMRYGITGVGYKISDFKYGEGLPDLDKALAIRAKHSDMFALLPAFSNQDVPATFDGQLPEVAYGEIARPPHIGEDMGIETNGQTVLCKLTEAFVHEGRGEMILRAIGPDGTAHIVRQPLSELELNAYRQNRNIFFGPLTQAQRNIADPLDLYDRLLASQKVLPPAAFAKQLEGHPDRERLLTLSQDEAMHEIAKALFFNIMQRR